MFSIVHLLNPCKERGLIGENPYGVVIIALFTPSTAMLEVFVQIGNLWVFSGFIPPDHLIDRLMSNPIHSFPVSSNGHG